MAWAAGKLEELRASDLRVQVLPSHMEKYRDPKSNPLRKIVAKAIDFVGRSGGIFGGEGGGLFHVAAERPCGRHFGVSDGRGVCVWEARSRRAIAVCR